MLINDPRDIPIEEGPFIVSKGGGIDLMSKLIRWRTKSWCEHSMLCINPGKLVWESTANWYGEGSMNSYMVPNVHLKFYSLVDINPLAVQLLRNYVYGRIKSPWYNKLYDYIGILGQAIGLPKVHTPGLEYCSVDAIHALKSMASGLKGDSESIINNVPDEESPGYLDLFMNQYPSVFVCKYEYQYGAKV